MIFAGLTGGIGSGKTTVAEIFETLHIPVLNTDIVAKQLMNVDETMRSQIISVFGAKAYLPNMQLNRKYLSGHVFNNKKELQKLNSIVHPAVQNYFMQWALQQTGRYILCESAIMIESGFYKQFDKIICVAACEQTRILRVMQRDRTDEATVRKRIENQMTDEERLKYADFVIYNNNDDDVLEQIIKIDKKIWENSQNI